MILEVFLALLFISLLITGLSLRGDIPELIGSGVAVIMAIVAAINSLELFVITNSGNIKTLDPQTDIALILLLIVVINTVFIFDYLFN